MPIQLIQLYAGGIKVHAHSSAIGDGGVLQSSYTVLDNDLLMRQIMLWGVIFG